MTDELSQENESGNELGAIVEAFEDAVYYVHGSVSKNKLLTTITYSGILGKLQATRDFVASCAMRVRDRRLRWREDTDDEGLRFVKALKYESAGARSALNRLIDSLQESTLKLGMIIEQCEALEERLEKQEGEEEDQ